MIIRVLGCYGNEYPGHRTTCILINKTITLDAGSITNSLKVSEQAKIRHLLITHAHLDHILDIGFLADNIIGRIAQPVEIIGIRSVLDNLMKYVLNDRIWPDFTKIPTREAPVLKLRKIKQRDKFKLEGINIRSVPVNHTVPTTGYILSEPSSGTIAFSSDTGPTREIWNAVNRAQKLKAVFIECSFPNRLQNIADVSGHLTPQTVASELKKIKNLDRIKVFLHHMKPIYLKEIAKDVKALKIKNVSILEAGQKIKI